MSCIPYDPSLLLGHVVPKEKYERLTQIGKLQAEVDSKRDDMNALIGMKRSFDMTKQELIDMNIDVDDLNKASTDTDDQIKEAAKIFASTFTKNQPEISKLKSELNQPAIHVESPIDYNKSMLKTNIPLASDGLKLNSKYFSFDEVKQGVDSTISAMKSFVSAEVSTFGDKFSAKTTDAIQKQVSAQHEHHKIDGTLIITATCTHKNAAVFAPFILDVEKGIRAWNLSHKSKKIKIDSPEKMNEIAAEEGTEEEEVLPILSGATYGSCFVGMVHVLRQTSNESDQAMKSVAAGVQAQLDIGCWFANKSGGFGIDGSFSNNVKNLLSNQTISTHVSIVCEGCIPTITSNAVEIGVKQFAEFDPSAMMDKLATLHNATNNDKDSVNSSAEASRNEQKMVAIRGSEVTNVMSSLADMKEKDDKMLDINSMMASFEDYVTKAATGEIGVPINFFIKSITRAQLAQMWVAKYYPGKYLNISGDDSGSNDDGKSSTPTDK